MKPLFVSYAGHKGGLQVQGWVVIPYGPLDDAMAIEHLCRKIEQEREYDANTLVLIGFQRLECP